MSAKRPSPTFLSATITADKNVGIMASADEIVGADARPRGSAPRLDTRKRALLRSAVFGMGYGEGWARVPSRRRIGIARCSARTRSLARP